MAERRADADPDVVRSLIFVEHGHDDRSDVAIGVPRELLGVVGGLLGPPLHLLVRVHQLAPVTFQSPSGPISARYLVSPPGQRWSDTMIH